MKKIILVHYINVGNMGKEDVKNYLNEISAKLIPKDNEIISYLIPVNNSETRVECLNPKLVSDSDYKQAKELLDRNQAIVDDIVNRSKQN